MTILEFLKSNDAEDIAKEILKLDTLGAAFDIGYSMNYFCEDEKCPYECRFLEKGNEYECECYNGMCRLISYNKDEKCPYSIDREEVVKEQIVRWLSSNMEES